MKLFEHQEKDIPFYLKNFERGIGVINNSDPGTGKTRTAIETIRATKKRGKTLVIAPKSILQAAWGNDIERFAPELRYVIATASNRRKAFETDADVYITNHDATDWLKENRHLLQGFYRMDVDESTAFKNPKRSCRRASAAKFLSKLVPIRNIMTGTFTPNGVLDAWNQVFLVDHGERLGTSFYKFRDQICDPIPGFQGHFDYADKPEAPGILATLLQDILIRHRFEDCIDIPENHQFTIEFEMNAQHRRYYREIEQHSMLQLQNGNITAFNAAGLHTKLLQAASGAIYTDEGKYEVLDTTRAELITELLTERDQAVVGFNWRHQRDQLTKLAQKAKFEYDVLDGSTPSKRRTEMVDAFQRGDLKVLYIHPQSGAHGLTLTAGTSTIWASPTPQANAEHFDQFNRRIYRAGQTKKTETALVCGKNTKDEHYYALLARKMASINALQALNELFTNEKLKDAA